MPLRLQITVVTLLVLLVCGTKASAQGGSLGYNGGSIGYAPVYDCTQEQNRVINADNFGAKCVYDPSLGGNNQGSSGGAPAGGGGGQQYFNDVINVQQYAQINDVPKNGDAANLHSSFAGGLNQAGQQTNPTANVFQSPNVAYDWSPNTTGGGGQVTIPPAVEPQIIPLGSTISDTPYCNAFMPMFCYTGLAMPPGSPQSNRMITGEEQAAATIMASITTNKMQNTPGQTTGRAKNEQNATKNQAADNLAAMERYNAGAAIDFVQSYLYNFTTDGGNQWNTVRNMLFVPAAILILLPGAIMSQIRAVVAQGFFIYNPIFGELPPFDGIMKSIIAIFMIPATYLVVNYGIDVANSLTYSVSYMYTQIFGTNMFQDAYCGHIRAFPVREPDENYGMIINQQANMYNFFGNTPLAILEGQTLDVKIDDPCAHIYIVPPDRANEIVPYMVNEERLAFNQVNAGATVAWTILCAAQNVYLYYLFLVGPIMAALFVYPSEQLKGALRSWVDGVITVCFWSLFWSTTILLMAICRGVDDTGTIMFTALNALAISSVKLAFDFGSLVRDMASQATSVGQKAAQAAVQAQGQQGNKGGGSPGGGSRQGGGQQQGGTHPAGTGYPPQQPQGDPKPPVNPNPNQVPASAFGGVIGASYGSTGTRSASPGAIDVGLPPKETGAPGTMYHGPGDAPNGPGRPVLSEAQFKQMMHDPKALAQLRAEMAGHYGAFQNGFWMKTNGGAMQSFTPGMFASAAALGSALANYGDNFDIDINQSFDASSQNGGTVAMPPPPYLQTAGAHPTPPGAAAALEQAMQAHKQELIHHQQALAQAIVSASHGSISQQRANQIAQQWTAAQEAAAMGAKGHPDQSQQWQQQQQQALTEYLAKQGMSGEAANSVATGGAAASIQNDMSQVVTQAFSQSSATNIDSPDTIINSGAPTGTAASVVPGSTATNSPGGMPDDDKKALQQAEAAKLADALWQQPGAAQFRMDSAGAQPASAVPAPAWLGSVAPPAFYAAAAAETPAKKQDFADTLKGEFAKRGDAESKTIADGGIPGAIASVRAGNDTGPFFNSKEAAPGVVPASYVPPAQPALPTWLASATSFPPSTTPSAEPPKAENPLLKPEVEATADQLMSGMWPSNTSGAPGTPDVTYEGPSFLQASAAAGIVPSPSSPVWPSTPPTGFVPQDPSGTAPRDKQSWAEALPGALAGLEQKGKESFLADSEAAARAQVREGTVTGPFAKTTNDGTVVPPTAPSSIVASSAAPIPHPPVQVPSATSNLTEPPKAQLNPALKPEVDAMAQQFVGGMWPTAPGALNTGAPDEVTYEAPTFLQAAATGGITPTMPGAPQTQPPVAPPAAGYFANQSAVTNGQSAVPPERMNIGQALPGAMADLEQKGKENLLSQSEAAARAQVQQGTFTGPFARTTNDGTVVPLNATPGTVVPPGAPSSTPPGNIVASGAPMIPHPPVQVPSATSNLTEPPKAPLNPALKSEVDAMAQQFVGGMWPTAPGALNTGAPDEVTYEAPTFLQAAATGGITPTMPGAPQPQPPVAPPAAGYFANQSAVTNGQSTVPPERMNIGQALPGAMAELEQKGKENLLAQSEAAARAQVQQGTFTGPFARTTNDGTNVPLNATPGTVVPPGAPSSTPPDNIVASGAPMIPHQQVPPPAANVSEPPKTQLNPALTPEVDAMAQQFVGGMWPTAPGALNTGAPDEVTYEAPTFLQAAATGGITPPMPGAPQPQPPVAPPAAGYFANQSAVTSGQSTVPPERMSIGQALPGAMAELEQKGKENLLAQSEAAARAQVQQGTFTGPFARTTNDGTNVPLNATPGTIVPPNTSPGTIMPPNTPPGTIIASAAPVMPNAPAQVPPAAGHSTQPPQLQANPALAPEIEAMAGQFVGGMWTPANSNPDAATGATAPVAPSNNPAATASGAFAMPAAPRTSPDSTGLASNVPPMTAGSTATPADAQPKDANDFTKRLQSEMQDIGKRNEEYFVNQGRLQAQQQVQQASLQNMPFVGGTSVPGTTPAQNMPSPAATPANSATPIGPSTTSAAPAPGQPNPEQQRLAKDTAGNLMGENPFNSRVRENYEQFNQDVAQVSADAASDQVKGAVEGASSMARSSLEGAMTATPAPAQLPSDDLAPQMAPPSAGLDPSAGLTNQPYLPVDDGSRIHAQPGNANLLNSELRAMADAIGGAPQVTGPEGAANAPATPGGDQGNSMIGRVLAGALGIRKPDGTPTSNPADGQPPKADKTQNSDGQPPKADKNQNTVKPSAPKQQSKSDKTTPSYGSSSLLGKALMGKLKDEEESFLRSQEEKARRSVPKPSTNPQDQLKEAHDAGAEESEDEDKS